jgi:hypothetical protein
MLRFDDPSKYRTLINKNSIESIAAVLEERKELNKNTSEPTYNHETENQLISLLTATFSVVNCHQLFATLTRYREAHHNRWMFCLLIA